MKLRVCLHFLFLLKKVSLSLSKYERVLRFSNDRVVGFSSPSLPFLKKKVVRCRNVYNLQCIRYTTPEHVPHSLCKLKLNYY